MKEPRILVVEDQPDLREVLEAYLRRDRYTVTGTGDGNHAWALFTATTPDLVLLDVMLPGLDGFELLRRIRGRGGVPVIMLTARDEDLDKLVGLRMGADDYVVKPANPAEVVARVGAVLRRTLGTSAAPAPISFGPVTLDVEAKQVRVDGFPVPLTATEYRLLAHLAANPGRTFTRTQLRIAALPESAALDRVVDAHVANLRRKLVEAGAPDGLLTTLRGLGYRLSTPREA